jgi:predicted transcriptional regulator
MSTLTLKLPDSLRERVKEFAKKEGISVNQFIASAITEKLSAFATKDYLEKRALRADEKKFKKALSQIPDVEPEEFDRLM